MYRERKTAVLTFTLAGVHDGENRALDVQREYQFWLTINEVAGNGGLFYTPLGDDRWHDLARAMRDLPETENKRHLYNKLYNAAVTLYETLINKSSELRAFLSESGPRRLVIRSNRPEIQALPWEAMIDDDGEILAHSDVSIVRSTLQFAANPWIFGSGSAENRNQLKIHGIFGPGVQELSFDALKRLQAAAALQADQGLNIQTTKQKTLSENWLGALQAEIIHIEAHGNLEGDIEMPEWFRSNDPIALAQHLKASDIVLLWSCYSGKIHPWGKSLGMTLHERGAKFVLSFSTPLRYETSAAIANQFYTAVFSARDPVDPETAIVEERKRLYQQDLMTGDWAAMTLWLRQPVDVSAAVLNGPRAPESRWSQTDGDANVEAKLRNKIGPGRAVLLTGYHVAGSLPYSFAETYRGAAVHLKGREGLNDAAMFQKLEVGPNDLKSHAADRFLLLLQTLSRYPRSLLVWSEIGRPEVRLVDFLSTEIPKNLDVVLISREVIEPSPNIMLVQSGNQITEQESQLSRLERLYYLGETDQFADLVELWDELNPDYAGWDNSTRLRYQINGYWSFIRVRKNSVEACITEVEKLDNVEGFLVRGNYQSRNSLLSEAQLSYEMAAEYASGPRDRARAWMELAYLYAEQSNPIAEDYYRRALETLEVVDEAERDWRWSSALGRVLRDFAEYFINKAIDDGDSPGPQSDEYLKRAMAIHAIDDRLNQVGAVLRTQGKLTRQRQQWPRAEAALLHAISIFTSVRNEAGWFETIRELAELSCAQRHYDQALVILRGALEKLKDTTGKGKGLLTLQIARLYWTQGELEEARTHYAMALKLLPEGFRKERAEAQSTLNFFNALHVK